MTVRNGDPTTSRNCHGSRSVYRSLKAAAANDLRSVFQAVHASQTACEARLWKIAMVAGERYVVEDNVGACLAQAQAQREYQRRPHLGYV